MKKVPLLLCTLLAIAIGAAAPAALAAGPPADIGARWVTPENARPTDAGETVYRCGTVSRGPELRFSQQEVDRWLSEHRVAAGGVIPVYVHVIYTSREGNVSDGDIAAQITVMNRNYAGRYYDGSVVGGAANTGYTFQLMAIDRRNNSKWFRMTPGSKAERDAKNATAVNPAGALNIWTCKPGQNLLGWSVFPWDPDAGTNQDGVVIHYASLPNGGLSPYNLGGTATHEVGHYLGLYHTFQGGCDTGSCSTSGDLVCDTPAEGSSTSGCPTGKDTCPATGLDPIHNYMDYSTDACYDNFTPGQDTRMNMVVTAPGSKRAWIGATRIAPPAASTVQSARGLGDGLAEFAARPNPFNPRTKIEFGLRSAGHASVRIYDVRGRLVRTLVDRELPAGNHSVDFDGDGLASGIYMMALSTPGQDTLVKRITLMK